MALPITYDAEEEMYTSPLYDLYRYYHPHDNAGFDVLMPACSCDVYAAEQFDISTSEGLDRALSVSGDLLELWRSPVSPEEYMDSEKFSFEEAIRNYAIDVGVKPLIIAYSKGVPLSDLLA